MKKIIVILPICLLFSVLSKSQTTTLVLLRHAEKDTSLPGATMMKADPPLSAQGERRAASLPELLKTYKIDSLFSTNYIRTKSTLQPLAQKIGLPIQLYDPNQLSGFAQQLRQAKGKTMVIVGHSNTIPSLVNLLIQQNKYQNLPDSVYNQIWIITLKNDQVSEKIIIY
jgi:broad specificity phosphatase PhoE